jgi:hypothetical protein
LGEQHYYKERYDFENCTWIIHETEVVICLILFLLIRVITKLPNSEQFYKGKVKAHKYINKQIQSTTGKLWKRNDPDLVQAFLKNWWVESDFKVPNLPLSLRLNVSCCHYNSMYNNTWTKQVKQLSKQHQAQWSKCQRHFYVTHW